MRCTQFFAALSALTLFAGSASATLLVYEGFQYETANTVRAGASLLDGQADDPGVTDTDATGLGGTWADSTAVTASSDMFMFTGSLSFGDLATSGNSVRSDTNSNNDNFGRAITPSLSGSSEIWFSFLGNKLLNTFSAAEGGLVIGNQQVNNSRVLEDDGTTGLAGFGFGPTTTGDNWSAYAWNGSSQVDVGAALGVATDGSETNLFVGHVSYNTGTGGADVFSAYYYDTAITIVTADIGNLIQIGSSIEVDIDESTLDVLSMTRQVNTAYDEIRIATTLDEALGLAIPEASTFALIGLSGLLLLCRRRA